MSEGSTSTTPTRSELWDVRHVAHDPIGSGDADPTLVESHRPADERRRVYANAADAAAPPRERSPSMP